MKSRTLLVLATVVIPIVASAIVSFYMSAPKVHGQLEIIDLEPIDDDNTNVYFRWYGNNADVQCTVRGTYLWALGDTTTWTEHVSYGEVFNVTAKHYYYDVFFCFDDKEVHLTARHTSASLRHKGGELYFEYGENAPKF